MEIIKLARADPSKPWGFRISGGKDIGVVLSVQRVNPGSLADEKGLRMGDALVSINGQDTTELRHKEAQDAILRGGNQLELAVQRGGASNWKPGGAKPVASSGEDTVTAILHQQYNSPINMYSMNNIAETLTAHAEMIAPGVMGINFMKPEHPINTMSEVYRLVQEEEQMKAKSPTPPRSAPPAPSPSQMAPRRAAPPVKTPPPVLAPKPVMPPVMMNSASAPAPAPVGFKKPLPPPPPNAQGTCSDCGRYITASFARVGDKILHEECFKCSTCGASLQSIGYSSLNNKLYCEVHAKLAARVIATETVPTFPQVLPMSPLEIVRPGPPTFKPLHEIQAPLATSASAPSIPSLPLVPEPMPIPPPTQSFDIPAVPTPYVNPHSPSSAGNLTFRSISPLPFKKTPGDFHRVAAPSSPTPDSPKQAFIPEQTGPLPFESKPYMPPGQTLSTYQTTSQVSQMSQMTQSFQQTMISQQSQQQYQMDFKQMMGQQKGTKFVWPPPKPEETLTEKKPDSAFSPPQSAQQIYSPLATQSCPPESHPPSSFNISQPGSAFDIPSAPKPYVPPPLPSTFSKPQEQESAPPAPQAPPAPEAPIEAPSVAAPTVPAVPIIPAAPFSTPAPAPAPASSIPGFQPVLAPVVDTESKSVGGGVPQSGVPTGAGSRPAPRRGKGQMKEQIPGCRIPICSDCGSPIRGPFIIALGKTWCPDHFICNNLHCKRGLQDVGFVEEQGQLYCENCYEAFLAPICNKCNVRIKGDCLNALDKSWHPDCFLCAYCHKPFGNSSFYLEDGLPYCEKDWNELFTTKCVGCGFPIEAGDRWVEALNNNYHSQCFKCSICSKNLEGQSFFAKGGRPFCKAHAR